LDYSAIGLFYSSAAFLTALSVHSRRVMPWMIRSSLIGAIVCFFALIWLGGYPKGSQADLSFLLLAPVSIAFGGLLGSGLGVAFWRSRVGV
jgi:ABC-type polysaccharide/polyol phosphate export permease